jgi:hypothetical protein
MSEIKKIEKGNLVDYINLRISKRPDVLIEEIDEETVLFDPQNRNTYALNQVGSIIWQLCDGEHTSREISEEISDVLGVDSAQVLKDVLKIINELLDNKLVETN